MPEYGHNTGPKALFLIGSKPTESMPTDFAFAVMSLRVK
jgi:hypothetical protein